MNIILCKKGLNKVFVRLKVLTISLQKHLHLFFQNGLQMGRCQPRKLNFKRPVTASTHQKKFSSYPEGPNIYERTFPKNKVLFSFETLFQPHSYILNIKSTLPMTRNEMPYFTFKFSVDTIFSKAGWEFHAIVWESKVWVVFHSKKKDFTIHQAGEKMRGFWVEGRPIHLGWVIRFLFQCT